MNILLLASQSKSRATLLTEAKIPFQIIGQTADESACDTNLPFNALVESIALSKMKHAQLPIGSKRGQIIFVLTADTMGRDERGVIHGKPINKHDAIEKLQKLRYGVVCTAFCLHKKMWTGIAWKMQEEIVQSVFCEYEFHVPDEIVNAYFHEIDYMQISGAVKVEGYGAQFLKRVSGSYSAIEGLPLYEVRQSLQKIGFFGE
jgi:septum formation protein